MDLQEVGSECTECIALVEGREGSRFLVNAIMKLRVPYNAGNFLISWRIVGYTGRVLFRGIIVLLLIIINIIVCCYFMRGIYNYLSETNTVCRVCSVDIP
jgi:hypothetical protein